MIVFRSIIVCMAKRANFSQETVSIISARAAYRCSFPGCDATLIGPGGDSNLVDNIGECAHIYAAANKGPRSNHSLSKEDLQKPENGIFLCRKHHALVDKGKGIKYPAETLMLYKQMHEHKISEELGHVSYPLLWIKKVVVLDSPILKAGLCYDFTKSTIIEGTNGAGKSVLVEYIYAALTGECVKRMRGTHVVLSIELSNPVWQSVTCTIDNGTVKYKVGEKELAFCPFSVDVVYLRDYDGPTKGDLIDWMGNQLGKDRQFVKALIEGADLSSSYVVKKVRMETVRKHPYETIRVCLQKINDAEDDCHWHLEQFSGTERCSVLFDLVVGYMRSVSRYKNTLFLFDWSYINMFSGSILNHYFKVFHNSCNYFQTIVAMHTLWEGVDWSGWNLIKMTEEDNLDIKWEQLRLSNI
jgi:hypothetical protein